MPLNIDAHYQNNFALSKYLHDNVYVSETHQMPTPASYGPLDELPVPCVQSHTLTDALMMLGQENQTKHLNVCLVQHRLEEGSEVV
jgi:hypothetical protein